MKNNVTLYRFAYLKDRTLGVLEYMDRRFFTLELPWRCNKPGVSCVPDGTYKLLRDEEGRYVGNWELQNVPGRSEIIIHAGNKPSEIRGCILLGMRRDAKNDLLESRVAVSGFHEMTKELSSLELSIVPFTTGCNIPLG